MRKFLLAVLVLLSAPAFGQSVDKYGGNTAAPCPTAPPYANRFYSAKVGDAWRLCTPLQNSFFEQFVYDLEKYPISGGDNYLSIVTARYGTAALAQAAEQKQLLHYGFNGAAPYALKYFQATTPCATCTLMPFATMANSSGYGLTNSGGWGSHAIKDVVKQTNRNEYDSYAGSSPDYLDPQYAIYASNSISLDTYGLKERYTKPNNDFLVGWVMDETDTLNGFGGNSKDGFGAVNSGVAISPSANQGQAVLGYIHLLTPPLQTAGNGGISFRSTAQLYSDDTKVYVKENLVNWLQGATEPLTASVVGNGSTATYTVGTHPYNVGDVLTVKSCSTFNTTAGVPVPVVSITSTTVTVTQAVSGSTSGCTTTTGLGHTVASLNAAWGSTYTAFASAGTTVTDTVCAGSCSNTTYSGTLSHTLVAPMSVQVLVNDIVKAGDCPQLNLAGCSASAGQGNWIGVGSGISGGSITHSTGAYSITFSAAPTDSVKIRYTYGGWGQGTTVADEDGHNAWIPANGRNLTGATAGFIADMDNYTYQAARKYFQQMRNVVNTVDPGRLYLGPTVIGTWCQPAHRSVLKAAGQYVDVPQIANTPCGVADDQARYDYNVQYLGDKPFTVWMGFTANSDSYYHATAPSVHSESEAASQAARGQRFYDRLTWMLSATDATYSTKHYVGYQWWEWRDNSSEHSNWGMVSVKGNVYDGVESKMATVSCNPAVTGLTYGTSCGGETQDYGDVVTKVKQANALWIGGVVDPPVEPPAATGVSLSGGVTIGGGVVIQ